MKRLNAGTLIIIFIFAVLIPLSIYGYDYYNLPGIKGYKPPSAKSFPWKPPYTGEQLMYLIQATENGSPIYINMLATYINHEGHMRHEGYQYAIRTLYENYSDKLDYYGGRVKAGDIALKSLIYWWYPPSIDGEGFVTWDYLDTPEVRKDANRWLYSPNLRRIRRLSGSERADTIGGGDFTWDDILGREVFEMEHKIIGIDYLYPEDLGWNCGILKKTCPPWTKYYKQVPLKCTVVESKSKLPDYYLSKMITWIYGPTKDFPAVDIRQEHYDRNGNLWRIRDRYWFICKTKFGKKVLVAGKPRAWYGLENIWDCQIDHRTIYLDANPTAYSFADQDKVLPDKAFNPESFTAEWDFARELRIKWPMYEKLRPLLPHKPYLYPDKFPSHRKFKKGIFEKPWIKEIIKKEKDAFKKRGGGKK